ncbi:bacteriocin immunity protein [Companilactobacillus baiquanensis]|uniref:Bacteriocin immunity protein n=1 Tax=Companilactobacillus baiquanensis TaxID=2486005 RepID=A0ABW1UYY8_9LACO|nr:bacteriocin immunity protein [Companilactobacillus baiquanensis]
MTETVLTIIHELFNSLTENNSEEFKQVLMNTYVHLQKGGDEASLVDQLLTYIESNDSKLNENQTEIISKLKKAEK